MDLSPLQSGSPSFLQVEYDLQSLSKASTLRILSAWEISNPNLTVQFDRRSKNLLILDSWVDTESLKSPNTETEIVKKGFQCTLGPQGMPFPVGFINLVDQNNSSGKIKKRVIFCKVAVGRSFCAPDLNHLNESIPEGYDSYYIDPDFEEGKAAPLETLDFCKENAPLAQCLKFYLKDTSQVLPRFIVEFEFDPKAEKQSRQKSVCENCESVLATIYCQADSAHLCDKCDAEIHKSKLSSRHVRLSLEKGPQCVVPCRSHPERIAEFFCPTCHVLVCLNCKMIGHHSTGEAVRHPLVAVTEAYQSVVEAAHAPDPTVEERKTQLKGHLNKINKRGQSILANAKKVKDHIEEIYKKSLVELNSIVNKRLLVLKGDAQEYKRLLAEIDRTREYLEYLETGRDATLFLLSWHQYLQAKAELPLLPSSGKENQSNESPLYVSGTLSIQSEGKGPNSLTGNISSAMDPNSSTFSLNITGLGQDHHYSQRVNNTSSLFKLSSNNNNRKSTVGNFGGLNSSPLVCKESESNSNNNTNESTAKKTNVTEIFTEALQSLDLSHQVTS